MLLLGFGRSAWSIYYSMCVPLFPSLPVSDRFLFSPLLPRFLFHFLLVFRLPPFFSHFFLVLLFSSFLSSPLSFTLPLLSCPAVPPLLSHFLSFPSFFFTSTFLVLPSFLFYSFLSSPPSFSIPILSFLPPSPFLSYLLLVLLPPFLFFLIPPPFLSNFFLGSKRTKRLRERK